MPCAILESRRPSRIRQEQEELEAAAEDRRSRLKIQEELTEEQTENHHPPV
jgi:hypothetical protein